MDPRAHARQLGAVVQQSQPRPRADRVVERSIDVDRGLSRPHADAADAAALHLVALHLQPVLACRDAIHAEGRGAERDAVEAHCAATRLARHHQLAGGLGGDVRVHPRDDLADLRRVPVGARLRAGHQLPTGARLIHGVRVVARLHVGAHHVEARVQHLPRSLGLAVQLFCGAAREGVGFQQVGSRAVVVGSRQVPHGRLRASHPALDVGRAQGHRGRRDARLERRARVLGGHAGHALGGERSHQRVHPRTRLGQVALRRRWQDEGPGVSVVVGGRGGLGSTNRWQRLEEEGEQKSERPWAIPGELPSTSSHGPTPWLM